MDGNNWLRIGTGFAGTAVEDKVNVFICVGGQHYKVQSPFKWL